MLSHVGQELGRGHGGNITYLLTDEEVAELGYTPGAGRKVDLKVPDGVRGKYVLVTATGSYFRELRDDPDHLLGICYIPEEGDYYEIAYGLEDNRPTSEFPAHLATHAARLAVDLSSVLLCTTMQPTYSL